MFLHSARTVDQESSPCPPARPSSDGMDIDSPGYAQPHHGDSMSARSSQMGSDDQPTGISRFCQRTSRSGSQSSIGKRSRSDEDDELEHPSSRPSSSSSSSSSSRDRELAPEKRVSSPPRLSLPAKSQAGRLFGLSPRLPGMQTGAFSPSINSSPSETISPSIGAAAKMTLGRRAGQQSLGGFRFPASKSHVPSVTISHGARSEQYGKGSLGSASGSKVAPRRPGLGVVQSSATLFGRHQSTSTMGVNRQRDAVGRPAAKSRRAISFAAAEGDKVDILLQADSMAVDQDEEDEESEIDASSVFNCSPAPRTSHTANFLVSGTWPKSTESPIRPNRSVSYNDCGVKLTRKTSAPGPSTSSSLAPPSFNRGMSDQSPSRHLRATFGSVVESPVGMPFSEKERAGKILPCHKVSNDGLMRISPDTMDRLLEGLYDDSISQKIVVDCRFGYEYEGGHIRAAINIHDKTNVDKMLLQGEVFARGQRDVPLPSESGKMDSAGQGKKVVVVFHCEYSAMRAPTIAKYLREQDRHMNMTHYPALYYPEVYILEGGYARYFAHSPQNCDGTYVKMDDPGHRSDRHADLNQFRTRESAVFSRAKSFTYGESKKMSKNGGIQKKPTFLLTHARSESHKPRDIFGAKNGSEECSQYLKIVEEDEEDFAVLPVEQ
ncbi:hypothetical protein Pst134EA_013804 [Puccinia striiformis f. sp. tritici]|nr:hypothetical protein Pst134EA_013804 [Puccinia striiformis f. sp. tritici]KAH9465949.1 hypothetical protein Pst134EA_013804 [Puccinia striiformis f. sp. tritici]